MVFSQSVNIQQRSMEVQKGAFVYNAGRFGIVSRGAGSKVNLSSLKLKLLIFQLLTCSEYTK